MVRLNADRRPSSPPAPIVVLLTTMQPLGRTIKQKTSPREACGDIASNITTIESSWAGQHKPTISRLGSFDHAAMQQLSPFDDLTIEWPDTTLSSHFDRLRLERSHAKLMRR